MQTICTSNRKHYLKFDSLSEALAFRNEDYAIRAKKFINARARARLERRAGLQVTRPSKMPRHPAPVSFDPVTLTLDFIVKHQDYSHINESTGFFLWQTLIENNRSVIF